MRQTTKSETENQSKQSVHGALGAKAAYVCYIHTRLSHTTLLTLTWKSTGMVGKREGGQKRQNVDRHADHQKAAAMKAETTTAAIANACDEEPKAGAAAPVEVVAVELAWLAVTLAGLEVVVTIPLEEAAGVLVPPGAEVVVAAGVVEPPMATVGADIKLCSVALKVPVMPVRLK